MTVLQLSDIQAQLRKSTPVSSPPQILAVSKLQPEEKIRALYQSGQRLFAENYIQEALPKIENLKNLNIEWHLIGRLQKNKAKLAVGNFALIHSVDSLELAQAINRIAEEKGLTQKILLQVNIADEESKGGFDVSTLLKVIPELQMLHKVQIKGLMAMPPLFENPEESRPYFKKLKDLLTVVKKSFPEANELSMGTSSDFLVAAQEGSTLVRLGTVLFGERQQN